VNTSPSLAGQSAVAALPGGKESHVGDGVEVDDVMVELISVDVEDSSEEVDVIISSEDVEVVVPSDDVEVIITSEEVEVGRSLEVVDVTGSSSRSSSSIVEVIGSAVDVGPVSVMVDVVDAGSHTPIDKY
jgi:hypothetical protein